MHKPQSAKSSDEGTGWSGDLTVLLLGLVLIVGGINNVAVNIVGRLNVSIPAPGARAVQLIFGLVGLALVIRSIARLFYVNYWAKQFLLRRRRRHLGRLIIAMNSLRFDRGGIKDLLEAYKVKKSVANWLRVMKRVEVNRDKLMNLRRALEEAEANGELAHDFGVAHLLNEFLDSKAGSLYDPLIALQHKPPTLDAVIDHLLRQARLMDQRKSEIVRAQGALARRLGPPPN
jgi:hypothetical protein